MYFKTLVTPDKNYQYSHETEQQLCFMEFLSDFTDYKNERKKVKKTYFRTLYAIYLLTKHNKKRNRSEHYFGVPLIAETAFCSKYSVSRFLNSADISLFCDVTKRFMKTNIYKLSDWVYDFFMLFERSGMMKLYLTDYESWKKTFKLRIRNWLIPMIQKGRQIKDIYEEVMNKSSTRNPAKTVTVKELKTVNTTCTKFNNTYWYKNKDDSKGRFLPGIEKKEQILPMVEKKEQIEGRKKGLEQERKEHADLGAELSNAVAFKLSNDVGMSGGDIHQFLFKNSLYTVKKSTEILCSRMENLGFRPQSGVKALQAIINKLNLTNLRKERLLEAPYSRYKPLSTDHPKNGPIWTRNVAEQACIEKSSMDQPLDDYIRSRGHSKDDCSPNGPIGGFLHKFRPAKKMIWYEPSTT